MSNATAELEVSSQDSVFEWAAERNVELNVSQCVEGQWITYRSTFNAFDPQAHRLAIAIPTTKENGETVSIEKNVEVGISFRRGHKKCLFVTNVVGMANGQMLVEEPKSLRAVQRRAYQRVSVPSHRFIAVKLWEGGLPASGEVCFPICSGRVSNISMGGVLVDVRADQNPRLQNGDMVGVEIMRRPDVRPLLVEAQYRHNVSHDAERIGLGFQFLGLEHDLPGRSTLGEVAEFVRGVRRGI